MQYVLFLNAKVEKDLLKDQESIVDETSAILKNFINFHRKIPLKKGTLGNNSYIFQLILILTTQPCCAVCLLVNCKNLEASY